VNLLACFNSFVVCGGWEHANLFGLGEWKCVCVGGGRGSGWSRSAQALVGDVNLLACLYSKARV
jgi:hypothetical protein